MDIYTSIDQTKSAPLHPRPAYLPQ